MSLGSGPNMAAVPITFIYSCIHFALYFLIYNMKQEIKRRITVQINFLVDVFKGAKAISTFGTLRPPQWERAECERWIIIFSLSPISLCEGARGTQEWKREA